MSVHTPDTSYGHIIKPCGQKADQISRDHTSISVLEFTKLPRRWASVPGETGAQAEALGTPCPSPVPSSRAAFQGPDVHSWAHSSAPAPRGQRGWTPGQAERREKQTLSKRSRDWAKHQDRNWGAQEGRHSRQRGWAQLSRAICATHKAPYCRYCPCLVILLLITRETCIIIFMEVESTYLGFKSATVTVLKVPIARDTYFVKHLQ